MLVSGLKFDLNLMKMLKKLLKLGIINFNLVTNTLRRFWTKLRVTSPSIAYEMQAFKM